MLRALLWGSASALFLLLLASLFRVGDVPPGILAFLLGLAGTAAWRPDVALTISAVLIPVATWIGRGANSSVAWPETVVVAVLAGYALRQASGRQSGPPARLGSSIGAMIAVVLASLGARILVLRATTGPEAVGARLWDTLTATYFVGGGGPELDAAMRLVEGMLLLHAGAAVARASGSSAPRLVLGLICGAAAAGALNLWRVWLGAMRLDNPVLVFLGYLRTLRFNAHYGDVNAAGSYFVMTLAPALARSWSRDAWRWIPVAGTIATSLVLSGSRAAIVAAVAAALVVVLATRERRPARQPTRRALIRVGLGLALAIAGVLLVALLALRNASPASASLWIRLEFARTSMQMVRSAPLLGVGIGQYPLRAGEFTSPELLQVYAPASQENAHNNFLQVLGELGVIGFTTFLWVLLTAGSLAFRGLARDPANAMRLGAAVGALAFVITWFAGHPLLVDPPAFTFWLLFGALAGWDQPLPDTTAGRRARSGTVGVLLMILAVTLPARARHELTTANLEHQGINLSEWQDGPDGVRYREAGLRSTVFLPTWARLVTIPLRAGSPGQDLLVELRLDDRLADAVRVPSDRWLMLSLPVPHAPNGAQFRRLDLAVRPVAASERPSLMIGKVSPR